MLLCVRSVIDHRGRQNVVRTSVTHSAAPYVPLFCSQCHILTSSVCDLLLTRRTETWNLFVKGSSVLNKAYCKIAKIWY